jgi:hypothetical protein
MAGSSPPVELPVAGPEPQPVVAGGPAGVSGCFDTACHVWSNLASPIWRACRILVVERIRAVEIRNTAGLSARYRHRYAYAAFGVPPAWFPAGGVLDVAGGPDLFQVDTAGLARRLDESLPDSSGPPHSARPGGSGRTNLILAPAASALLLSALAEQLLVSRPCVVGGDPRLHIWDDPGSMGPEGAPVDDEGVARRPVSIVRDGVADARPGVVLRVCAGRDGAASTGSAVRPTCHQPPEPSLRTLRIAPFGAENLGGAACLRVLVLRPGPRTASVSTGRRIAFLGVDRAGTLIRGVIEASLADLLGRTVAAGPAENLFPYRFAAGGRDLLLADVKIT